jgi:uncharacterized protein (TIGR02266 family)
VTDTPSATADARKHPRYKVTILVDCSTRDLFVSNKVDNISSGGLFIRSEIPFPLNAEVRLILYLPAARGHIRATGRVVWNRHINKHSRDVVPGSGICFISMSASDRATLEEYLADLTPTPSEPPTPR